MTKLKNNKTTIVIAHRLSTIKDADIIVELKEGHVNDFGTHEQLMARKEGYYYNLVKNEEESKQNTEENEKNDRVDLERLTSEIRDSKLRARSSKKSSKKLRDSVINIPDEMEVPLAEVALPIETNYAKRVWAMNRKELVWILLSSVAYFVNGAIYPFVAFCFSQMVKIFTITDKSQSEQDSYTFTGIVIALSVLSFLASFFLNYATSKSGIRLTCRAKNLLFKALIHKPMDWFDQEENKLSSLVQGKNLINIFIR